MSFHAKYNQNTSSSMREPPVRKSCRRAKSDCKSKPSQEKFLSCPPLDDTSAECRNKKLLGNNWKRPKARKSISCPSSTPRRPLGEPLTGLKLIYSAAKSELLIVSLSRFCKSSSISWIKMSFSTYWQPNHWRARHRKKQCDWWSSPTQMEIVNSHSPSERKSKSAS